ASLPKESRGTLSFCLIWWLLPPLLFFTLGQVGEGALFQPRYFMWSSLALCILLAQALSLIHSRKVKVVSVVVFALLLLLLPRQWQRENWRDAIAAVNAVNGTETVLLYSGLFEADSVAKNVSEKDFDYLLSPLSPYPLKKMAILLPSSFESKSHERYFTQEIQPLLEHGDVLLLSPSMKQHLSPHGTVPKYFLAYFEIRGYGAEEIFSQGLVQAYRLKRLTPSST
ncbi:MAG: hypothetical protein KDD55_13045, partial [Bdellovibrionales bacterium]|nr:hypothetical protein [Bdellovibrionales bacterium]